MEEYKQTHTHTHTQRERGTHAWTHTNFQENSVYDEVPSQERLVVSSTSSKSLEFY